MNETTADPVGTRLAEVGQRADWVRKCERSRAPDAPYTLSVARRNSARDVRPLLAAVEAALARHVPEVIEGRIPLTVCSRCFGRPKWPCLEVRAISRALLGPGE